MLSVGPTDVTSGVLNYEAWASLYHYSMVHGDVEVGKFSCFFLSSFSY